MKQRIFRRAAAGALALCAALTALLPGCGGTPTAFSTHSFDYFDTVTTVTGYAASQEEFDRVADQILERLGTYHRLYTIYHRYDGLENLCTVNELVDGAHRTVTVDAAIIDLLTFAKEMYARTDGAVNVAMGSVLALWHDHRTVGTENPAAATLPPADQLAEAGRHTAIEHLVLDSAQRTVTLTDPATRLDVGAVAKGYAVEQVARWLETEGITGYVLNVGGNVRTVGRKPDGSDWTVGIENPEDTAGGDYLAYLHLCGEALVTSGSYQRYYLVDGKAYHHIIDPDTLMPAAGYRSVSVVCGDSALADALSTALFCMDLSQGQALIAALDGVEALWVAEDGAQTASTGWAKYTVK